MGKLKILVTGSKGQLGNDLMAYLSGSKPQGSDEKPGFNSDIFDPLGVDIDSVDITNRDAVLELFDQFRPNVVIHGAAFTAVDRCESEVDLAFAANAIGTRNIVEGARSQNCHVLYVSTDYVFDGTKSSAYNEWDSPNPLSQYGKSKLAGEKEVGVNSTIVRTSWVCGYNGSNMVKTVLKLLKSGTSLSFVDDQHGCPTFTADLSKRLIELALSKRPGIFHASNQGPTTWFDFARQIAQTYGYDKDRIEPISTEELVPKRPAPRPMNSVLDNMAFRLSNIDPMNMWEDSLSRLIADFKKNNVEF